MTATCRWCRRQIRWSSAMAAWRDEQGQYRCPDDQTPHFPADRAGALNRTPRGRNRAGVCAIGTRMPNPEPGFRIVDRASGSRECVNVYEHDRQLRPAPDAMGANPPPRGGFA